MGLSEPWDEAIDEIASLKRQLAEARDGNAQLERQLHEAQEVATQYCKQFEAAEADTARLVEASEAYMAFNEHPANCEWENWMGKKPCDCGHDALRAAIDAAREEGE